MLEDEVLVIGQDDCCTVSDPYVESCHVTPRKELFTSYKAGNFGRVKMGNDSYADIVGISDICVRANTGYTLILKDVRYVLNICQNLQHFFTHVSQLPMPQVRRRILLSCTNNILAQLYLCLVKCTTNFPFSKHQ